MFYEKAVDIASKLPDDFHNVSYRSLAAACIYVSSIGEQWGTYKPMIHQREVASYFKKSTMSVKKSYLWLLPRLKDMNTKLSEEEIEWLLNYRKEQLNKTKCSEKKLRKEK